MCVYVGLPWWLSGRESTCYVGATGDAGLTPGSGRSPGEGNGYPVQYSCLRNPTDSRTWRAAVHGVAKSRNDCVTEQPPLTPPLPLPSLIFSIANVTFYHNI